MGGVTSDAAAGAGPTGPKGPPRLVRKDTQFEVTIERDEHGLGIELDSANRVSRLVPGGQAARDGVLHFFLIFRRKLLGNLSRNCNRFLRLGPLVK